nr:ATP-binding protein [Conchiformibius kuhniae]
MSLSDKIKNLIAPRTDQPCADAPPLTESNAARQLLLHWAWQILYALDGQNNFIDSDGFRHTPIAELIGADEWFDHHEAFDPVAARRHIRLHYQAAQEYDFDILWREGVPPVLRHNVAQWTEMFDFSETESRVLTFVIMLYTTPDLVRLCALLGELDDNDTCNALSKLLDTPENDIAQALHSRGKLNTTGVLSLDRSETYTLRSKIDLLSRQFATQMAEEPLSPAEVLKEHITSAPQTKLEADNFKHLGVLAQAAPAHLRRAFADKQKGCNILIYGSAGTGKTEFTRVLAQQTGVELFEIAWADEDNRPHNRNSRINALRMAQNIFAGQKIMLMFDEVEDLFDRGQSDFSLNKAWLNRMLENNPVPTVWICNNVHLIDPSAVRRFDMVVEMKAPPVPVRAEMIRGLAGGYLPAPQIRTLAENDAIVPALLQQAHRVTESAAAGWQPEPKSELLQKLLHNTLKAQGHFHALNSRAKLPEVYNPAWINCKQDLQKLSAGIAAAGRGTLCLYGAPGTGKSAFASWLAECAGKSLLYKRSSDLLSKYVGETEQLIAAAFEQAKENDAVLVFDEVDGFLQDRRQARQNWEVTQVNEMLTQMEAFGGIFVASTNLMKKPRPSGFAPFRFQNRV